MLERLEQARDGNPTVFLGSVALHSRYNPLTEASRFLESLNLPSEPEKVLVLGPCLGFILHALRYRYPKAKILSVQFSSFYTPSNCIEYPEQTWTPADGSIIPFLENNIEDREASRLTVIEWKPALSAYAEQALAVLSGLQVFLKRAVANISTTKAFGLRWIHNAARNAAMQGRPIEVHPGNCSIVIAVAGPSLHEAIPIIKRNRSGVLLLAASSAVEALLAEDINPDAVVASDGGNWASYHLFESARHALPLFAGLTAAIPSSYERLPVVFFGDGSHWQSRIMQNASIAEHTIPQRGTISATAIDIAMQLSSGPIYIAGLDLASYDIQTHCRPYALNRFHEDTATRLKPRYTGAYERASRLKASTAHGVYTSWFFERRELYRGRVFMLTDKDSPTGFPASLTIATEGKNAVRMHGIPKTPPLVRSISSILDDVRTDTVCRRELDDLSGLKSGYTGQTDE